MHLFDDLILLERLNYLIRIKGTGTPAQLATRLGASERNLYRLIGRLRDQGFPIAYDKKSDSYYYTEPVKMSFEIAVGEEKLLQFRG
jgi:predicted DNA-binding transcriptional regulator YafY